MRRSKAGYFDGAERPGSVGQGSVAAVIAI
jgi:hypothetical protein